MAREGGIGAGKKKENWGSEEQNEEGKRGKEKEKKEKGESDVFLLIYGTHFCC